MARRTAIGATGGPTVDVQLLRGAEPILARITRRSFRTLVLAPDQPAFAILKSVAVGRTLLPG
jgi:molybdate transport system ATP-binding protein